jgi:hypothetical protein
MFCHELLSYARAGIVVDLGNGLIVFLIIHSIWILDVGRLERIGFNYFFDYLNDVGDRDVTFYVFNATM